MLNTTFEQYAENNGLGISLVVAAENGDTCDLIEICKKVWQAALDSKWNTNISEAPRENRVECLFIVKGYRLGDNSIRKLYFGCIDEFEGLYYEISLDEDQRGCFSCKHSESISYDEDGDAVKNYSEQCKGCTTYQLLAGYSEYSKFTTDEDIYSNANKYPNLFESKFSTEDEVNKAKRDFLNEHGVWYTYGGYEGYDEIGIEQENLIAWQPVITIPEHLKG